ncbi:MAG: hypothetical protein NUV54_01645 [Candidatus Taylorbacteria bacterium]|nr:hypothetical protein [Candidatus Taylorbacteria bacterium]
MIELTTNMLLLFSLFYSSPMTAQAVVVPTQIPQIIINDPFIVDNVALRATVNANKSVEGEVREYFKDTPILAEIAGCETRFRHTDKNGDTIRGEINDDDLGVMQINTYYHSAEAKKAGIQLATLKGNMAFAKRLYEKFGTSPWDSSSVCWKKFETVART